MRTGEESLEVISTSRYASIYLMLKNFLFSVLTKERMEEEVEARDRDICVRDKQTIY